jgi:ATP-dependent helicase HrpB
MNPLPVDEILPQLLSAIKTHAAVVVQAPPGAGKTTRVPLALLEDSFLINQKIVMLEPRRLAATNAARWMASLIGEEVGKTVGYTIRFERKVSASTRIEVVTEGILSRRLQSDPTLAGVGVVIFDEFHGRSLHSDLALALCRDAQQGLREDLKIIVMSATLDGASIAALLDHAPLVTSAGRSFPVGLRYLPREVEGRLPETVAAAIRRVLNETEGDILVFLPGVGEIRRCQKLLEDAADQRSAPLLCPLFGDLPFDAQEKAILPASRRKVVLATNIAETSLTIEGVRVVIDSGFCRQLRFDPASGLNRLVTARISAASATQRAGRAGRLGPGICYRLWTEHGQTTLIPFTAPEICSSDLTALALDLALWGVADAGSLTWLDPPPAAALFEGRALLTKLGALDRQGFITESGRRMAAMPLHPRFAHLLLEAEKRGYGVLACDVAALLTERDIFRYTDQPGPQQVSDSDMLDRVEALAEWRKRGATAKVPGMVDANACRAVERVSRQLRTILGSSREAPRGISTDTVGLLLAWAYPDRIAKQREAGSDRYLLVNGRGGSLSGRSAVRDHPFIVAVNMEGGERGDGLIHLASALTIEIIRKECSGAITCERSVGWDGREGRVVAREEERLGALLLGSRPIIPAVDEATAALMEGIRAGSGLAMLNWTPEAVQFQARVSFIANCFPEEAWPNLSNEYLRENLEEWLGPYLSGIRTAAQLSRLDMLPLLKNMLNWEQLRRLDDDAPAHIMVPSGSRIQLDYSLDGPPLLAVKLQEMFGLAETPTVARGRVAVVLHLLSPARRPIQVTRDLKSFWNAVYPEVKKEMKGRYPKHPWPDDPWNAVPTRHTKRR